MIRARAVSGAALALVSALVPAVLAPPFPVAVTVLAVLLLGAAGGLVTERETGRPVAGALLSLWAAACLLTTDAGTDRSAVVALLTGLALRGWATVPETARLGLRPELLVDLLGGLAAAAAVLLVQRSTGVEPAVRLVLALALVGVFAVTVRRVLRR